jgi:hypothetical protein
VPIESVTLTDQSKIMAPLPYSASTIAQHRFFRACWHDCDDWALLATMLPLTGNKIPGSTTVLKSTVIHATLTYLAYNLPIRRFNLLCNPQKLKRHIAPLQPAYVLSLPQILFHSSI